MADVVKILVVDDDPAIAILWAQFLRRWGYEPVLASDGLEGLERARSTPLQLVITDLNMPVMTGQDLLRRLKEEHPHLEVIVITGEGSIEIAVDMMKAGALDFLTKPIDFSRAQLVVSKAIAQAQAKAENFRLRRINRDLEELNEIKEKFIAITTHELRTPVSILHNVVQLLPRDFGEGREQEFVRLLGNSARHLREIVEQMHEVSHVNARHLQIKPTRFNLKDAWEEVHGEFALVLQKRPVEVAWEIPAQLFMRADRVKFKKVLRELLQNAIKFTADGGAIRVTAGQNESRQVWVTVSDNGQGIAPKHLDKIFDPFYEAGDLRKHHTSRDDFLGGGMGLGLAIVQDIVTAHHGAVRVVSEPAQGSSFTVTVPQQPATTAP